MLWKLLKQHISVAQLVGFFFANLCGMVIILLSFQFYKDVSPVISGNDSFIKNDYIVVSKKVSTLRTIAGTSATFSKNEVKDIEEQPFVLKTGAFQPSQFKVYAGLEFGGMNISTAMFFESVPDYFVDVKSDNWNYVAGQEEIPIIIPRNYLNLYNFGFAQSRSLPQLSEGMMGAISLNIYLSGNGRRETKKGRIVGFSNRLNTILVPEAFMNEANMMFGGDKKWEPSRLIIEVDNPADERIARFFSDNGYETENNKLDSGKTAWFLKLAVGVVMAIGLVISVLSFYILMLSVYLLLQKNTYKLENLILMGYSVSKVAKPYQILTIGLNIAVLLFAVILVLVIRGVYVDMLSGMFPGYSGSNMFYSLTAGIIILIVVSLCNILAIHRKVNSII